MDHTNEVGGEPHDVDGAILTSISQTDSQIWDELRSALDAVEGLPSDGYCAWVKSADSLPWPEYGPEVNRLRDVIAAAGLIVVFPWPEWSGVHRYRAGTGMDLAPVEDAVRMTTAVLRSERFVDGSIEGALSDGTLQAALRRVLAWVDSR